MMKTYKGIRDDRSKGYPVSVAVIDGDQIQPLKHIVRHSPDGFEWGYGGSGPAELARCILIDYFGGGIDGISEAGAYYQDFKWDKIATIHTEEWQITEAEIKAWLDSHKTDSDLVLA